MTVLKNAPTTTADSVFNGVLRRSLKTLELPAISVRTPESEVEPRTVMGVVGTRELDRRQRLDVIIVERENDSALLEERLDLIADEVETALITEPITLDNWYLIGEETEVVEDGDNLFGFHTLSYMATYTTPEGRHLIIPAGTLPAFLRTEILSGAGFTHDDWDALVYAPIIIDEGSGNYRMFYTGFQADGLEYGPCVATSIDAGATWTKPNLGLITFGGNTNNNIFLTYTSNLSMIDVHYAGGTYTGLFRNDGSNTNLIYTSTDGVAFTWQKTVFTNTTHGERIEAKAITYESGVYRVYYNEGHTTLDQRSIGFYSATTLAGPWTDQDLITAFTSSVSTLQFYDIKIFPNDGQLLAAVNMYNSTTEILGPIRQYISTDDGVTWAQAENDILDMGAAGTFDDELITVGKPVKVGREWDMLYVGSSENHSVWPRPMVFAWARTY